MTQMVRHEHWVNDNVVLFIEQLRKRFVAKEGPGASMDVMEWVTYFSLDTIHEITFGEQAGFVEERRDVNGVIAGEHQMLAHTLYVNGNLSGMRCQNSRR